MNRLEFSELLSKQNNDVEYECLHYEAIDFIYNLIRNKHTKKVALSSDENNNCIFNIDMDETIPSNHLHHLKVLKNKGKILSLSISVNKKSLNITINDSRET